MSEHDAYLWLEDRGYRLRTRYSLGYGASYRTAGRGAYRTRHHRTWRAALAQVLSDGNYTPWVAPSLL